MSHKPKLRIWLALLLAPVLARGVEAKPFMVVGNDEKVVWDDEGKVVLSPPGKDTVTIVDLADPARPKVVASLQLENSVIGPPTNVAVSPSGGLALVANSLDVVREGDGLKQVPAGQVHVIDLEAIPPRLLTTLSVGKQPSGLAIGPKGDLALIGDRAANAVDVLAIKGKEVSALDPLAMPAAVATVAFTPDGRRALAVMQPTNQLALLEVADGRVTDSKIALPVGLAPYNAAVTPDGRIGLAVNAGNPAGCDGNADDVAVIDLRAAPPRVVERITVGDCPEGLAISPKGDLAAVTIIRGSNAAKGAFFRHDTGTVQILRIARGRVTAVQEIGVGAVPEAIVFSPDGGYLYAGNYLDRTFSILRIRNGKASDTGRKLSVPGHPASARAGPS